MNGWRGSLTIEAALVVPLVLALFAFAMKSGIQMYTECRDTALAIGQEQEIEAVKMFYRWQEAGELFQNEEITGLFLPFNAEFSGMIRSSAWKTDPQLERKIAVDPFL